MVRVEFLGPIQKKPLELDINNLNELAKILQDDSEMQEWLKNSAVAVNDTLVSIITNHDINETSINYDYSLQTSSGNGSTEIIEGYFSKIESENLEYLFESNIFNNKVVSGITDNREEINYAYPQPFNYSSNSYMFIPTKQNEYGFAKLSIYSASMKLVYSGKKSILANEKIIVRWKGLDNNGKILPSGIYIYVTESDGEVVKGKIAILNN